MSLEAAQACFERGDHAGALAALDALGDRGPDDPLRSGAALLRAELLARDGQLDEAHALVKAAHRAGQEHGWPDEHRGVTMLGRLLLPLGRTREAIELLTRARSMCRRAGDPLGLSIALRWSATAERRRGNHDLAIELLEESLALSQRLDDRFGVGECCVYLGSTARESGHPQQAIAHFERGHAAYAQIPNGRGQLAARVDGAYLMAVVGDLAGAERAVEEAEALQEQMGVLAYTPVRLLLVRGDIARLRGDHDTARRYFEEARDDPFCTPFFALYVKTNLALVAAEADQPERCAALLAEAAEHGRDFGVAQIEAVLHGLRAWLAARSGGPDAWDEHHACLVREIEAHHLRERDLGWLGQMMGVRWEAQREHSRAARSYALALEQAADLGREDEVRTAREALVRVAAGGAAIPIGPFELLHVLGSGGVGEVWEGRHRRRDLPVAIKLITDRKVHVESAVESFSREVRVVAKLDHPCIVRVFDHGRVSATVDAMSRGRIPCGAPYLVMALHPQGDLASHCGKLSWPQVLVILGDLLDGLAHAHAHQLLHLDVKPQNILLSRDPHGTLRARLSDFGLARAHAESQERLSGTPAFMAPEQIRNHWRRFGPWTDLYGVGCVAAALVSGAPPFRAESVRELLKAHLSLPPPRLKSVVPVPNGFEGWVHALLAKQPEDRPWTAADAARSLRALPDAEALQPIGERVPWPQVGAAETWLLDEAPEPPAPAIRSGAVESDVVVFNDAGLGLVGVRTTPFIGREAERAALLEHFDAVVRRREPAVVHVTGGPGLGKSRLVRWLATHLYERGDAVVLRTRVRAESRPGEILSEALQGFLHADAEFLDEHLRRLLAQVSDTPVPPEQRAVIAELLDPRPWTDAREEALAVFLQRFSEWRPGLLLIEDVHHHAAAVQRITSMLARCAGSPILCLLTTRDDLEGDAVRAALAELGPARIELGPLGEAELRALVRRGVGVDGDVARRVAERVQGNPQFALQLLEHWLHAGDLVPGEGGLRVRGGARTELPSDLGTLWTQRVDGLLTGLPSSAAETLEIAAFLGTRVRHGEWGRACRAARVPIPATMLRRLHTHQLVELGDEGWAFRSAMLRESIARRALAADRAESHHAAIAVALKDTPGAEGRLGRHLLGAGEPRRAAECLSLAAEAAIADQDGVRATLWLQLFERALRRLGLGADHPLSAQGRGLAGQAAQLRPPPVDE